eukprot:1156843-Pelagomonas_calceolata.AAC.18
MVIAEDGVAYLFCAQFSSLILLLVPEPQESVPGVFGGRGHGVVVLNHLKKGFRWRCESGCGEWQLLLQQIPLQWHS